MNRRALWELLKDSVLECVNNKAQRLAAALAYYAMFSLGPLLIILVLIAGLVYGQAFAESEVLSQLQGLVGDTGAQAIGKLIESIYRPTSDIGTTVIGVAGLLFGGSALFNHLKDSLNTIWQVAPKPERGTIKQYIIDRCLALIMVLSVATIALIGLLLSIGATSVGQALGTVVSGSSRWYLIRGAQLLLSFCVVTLLVALTYRVLPDTTITWRDVWTGATITGLLLVGSQALVGFYLRSTRIDSAYSIIGVVVIMLVWVYYSALIFFFGAEFTWVYANRYGSRIVPAAHAMPLSSEKLLAQGMLSAAQAAALANEQEQQREVSA